MKMKNLNLIYILTPIAGVSFVSIILLIFFSPVYSIMWLVLSSFYFLYVKNYKSIYKIWFITITIWYLIFTTTLAEIPILIGFKNTKVVLIYLIQNDVLFANLCFQTVIILDLLSSKLGFPIYIPAFINIIKLIIDCFKPSLKMFPIIGILVLLGLFIIMLRLNCLTF
jgi:hypothetical protein